MTVGMIIKHRSSFSHGVDASNFLFANMSQATRVFNRLEKAVRAYHDRANDREKVFRFNYLNGSAAVDVGEISVISIETPFGKHADTVEDWNRKIGKLNKAARGEE